MCVSARVRMRAKTLSSMFGDLKDSPSKGQHKRHWHDIKGTL